MKMTVLVTSVVLAKADANIVTKRSYTLIFAAGLNYSSISGNDQTFLAWLDKWLKPVTSLSSYWKHCYQATVNGWSASVFHSNCDGKGPSVTIIRVGKYIFGGYTSVPWESSKLPELFHLTQAAQAKSELRGSDDHITLWLCVPCVYLALCSIKGNLG